MAAGYLINLTLSSNRLSIINTDVEVKEMEEKAGSNTGWAGPALFLSVLVAMLAFFVWFLG